MTKRVLFIDDELELWENALREELSVFDFEVLGEDEPSKALKVIASFNPDIVLLDILFPEGYLGKPTLEKIKSKHPDLPVIMITSTMDKSEYNSEDYIKADYRYSKEALAGGDFSDLATQLDRLIDNATREQRNQDDTGLARFGFLVGKTKAMLEVTRMIDKIADQDHTVLITGESGTGKELVAGAIHNLSKQMNRLFAPVVCAAIPKDLLESELFGIEKGVATGVEKRIGKIEQADGGTLFLDEIGDVPLDTQVKLLRFLQEKQFMRVGGDIVINSNTRIIASTNQNLKERIKEDNFREDLYFRLNVVSIQIPPLRERKVDIQMYFDHFVKKANQSSNGNVLPILRSDVRKLFISYSWPGNIRELENMINRAVALADENILQVSNFPDLVKHSAEGHGFSSDISYIVNRIFKRELTWTDLSKEFGARGTMRKEALSRIGDQWIEKHQHRPSSEDLAMLLSVSPGNMRRILSENCIKLAGFK